MSAEELKSASRLVALQALRDVLAETIPTADSHAVAPLVRQMTIVLEQIEQLAPPEQKGTALDELNARRSARGADAARQPRSTV